MIKHFCDQCNAELTGKAGEIKTRLTDFLMIQAYRTGDGHFTRRELSISKKDYAFCSPKCFCVLLEKEADIRLEESIKLRDAQEEALKNNRVKNLIYRQAKRR